MIKVLNTYFINIEPLEKEEFELEKQVTVEKEIEKAKEFQKLDKKSLEKLLTQKPPPPIKIRKTFSKPLIQNKSKSKHLNPFKTPSKSPFLTLLFQSLPTQNPY